MNMISSMIPEHNISFLMFCTASLARGREHNIQNAPSPGFGHQRLMGLRVCGLIGLCSDAIPQIYIIIERGIPQALGLAR